MVDADDERWQRIQEQARTQGASGPLPSGSATVTIYRNGFQVNDGPFRNLLDPLNKKFMDEISLGTCPAELSPGGEDVSVALVDKRGEDYKEPPPPAYVKFSGEGASLGGGSAAAAATPVQADAGTIAVDPTKPKTKIQIRFHDGSRKAQEFNEDHTVGDLRAFVAQCAGGAAMTILGGFPPQPLMDDAVTLKAGGLCGAAVTVKPS